MRFVRVPQLAVIAAALMMLTAAPAQAQRFEVGTSLAGANIGLGDVDLSTVGVPTAGFNLLSPMLYASFFVGSRFAVEPQVGLVWATQSGESSHFLSVAGQADYFLKGTRASSPYVFGTVGVLDVSDSDTNPASVGVGGGYRMVAGGRLCFRFDGRYVHFTKERGNVLGLAVSIGGLFGR